MRTHSICTLVLPLVLVHLALLAGSASADQAIWFSPLAMRGENQLTLEVGQPSTSLRVYSSQTGDLQWVFLGLDLPADQMIDSLTICYQLANPSTYIRQTRLSVMTDPGATTVYFDDVTNLESPVPTCQEFDVQPNVPTNLGLVTLALRLDFASIVYWVEIGGVRVKLTPLATSVGPENAPAPGVSATLGQNRPNPFNPSTVIDFDAASPGSVRLRIFDVAGRLVRTLLDTRVASGEHHVYFDGRDDSGGRLASGAYFYELRIGDETQSRRMILVQ